MSFISVTRLRLRSVRYLPGFVLHTFGSLRQVRKAPGFRGGSLLPDRRWAFWTMTAWDNRESMRRYMTTGSHRTAMPRLLDWCDEASVVHWEQPEDAIPTWAWADKQMRETGRASKVHNPSSQHVTLTYRTPRTFGAGPIRPAKESARNSA